MHSINRSSWHVFPLNDEHHDFSTRSAGKTNKRFPTCRVTKWRSRCFQWAEFIPPQLLTRGRLTWSTSWYLEKLNYRWLRRERNCPLVDKLITLVAIVSQQHGDGEEKHVQAQGNAGGLWPSQLGAEEPPASLCKVPLSSTRLSIPR